MSKKLLQLVGAAAGIAAIVAASPAAASAATGTLLLRDSAGHAFAIQNPPASCIARDIAFNYVSNRLDTYVVAYDSPYCWGTATYIPAGQDRRLSNLNRSVLIPS